MTKSELIEQISEKLNLPNGRAEQIVNCVFDSMIHALQEGDGIEIRGFGSFTVREYKSYDGRNPRTGEAVHVAPKRLPFFKVGKDLRERVDGTSASANGPDASANGSRDANARSTSAAQDSPDRSPSARRPSTYELGDGRSPIAR